MRAWKEEPPTEAKTDAEEMTDVINEVKVTDDTHILTTEYVEPVLTSKVADVLRKSASSPVGDDQGEPKPKASNAAKPRASRAKPKVEETKPVLTSKVAD